jgi:hypothetical protein
VDERERDEAVIQASVARLTGRFGDNDVPREDLEAEVRTCFAKWPDAKVRDFIPILAERCARARIEGRGLQ